MKKAAFTLAAAALLASAGTAAAQGIPLSVEARVDAAFPTGDFGEAVSTAPSFGVNASLGVARGLAVYGGYSRTAFEVEGSDRDAVDQGFAVGLTAGLPVALPVQPWVGAGVLFHELEVEDGPDDDSDVGFEVGAGIALPIAPNLRLTPGVGYRRYATNILTPVDVDEIDVSYFTAGVGLNFSF